MARQRSGRPDGAHSPHSPHSQQSHVQCDAGPEAAAGTAQHVHSGPHQQTQAVLSRLARTEGHVRAVRRMVEAGRPCADVLIQLAAVRAAVDRVARLVLEDHLESCLRQAASNGNAEAEWNSLKEALDRFIS